MGQVPTVCGDIGQRADVIDARTCAECASGNVVCRPSELQVPCSEADVEHLAEAIRGPPRFAGDPFRLEKVALVEQRQTQLLAFAHELPDAERASFYEVCFDIDEMPLKKLLRQALKLLEHRLDLEDFKPPAELKWPPRHTVGPDEEQLPLVPPGASYVDAQRLRPRWRSHLFQRGLDAIGASSVAVVLLAGSSDRRAGHGVPTAMMDFGLLSNKSIFQLYCERIIRIKRLAQLQVQVRASGLKHAKEELREGRRPGFLGILDDLRRHKLLTAGEVAVPVDENFVKLTEEGGEGGTSRIGSSDDESSSSWSSSNQSFGQRKSTKTISSNRNASMRSLGVASENRRESKRRFSRMTASMQSVDFGDGTTTASRARGAIGVRVPLCIMCNEGNIDEVQNFFSQADYFGLSKQDVFFCVQGNMPALDPEGFAFLETPHRVAQHPNGSGGVFRAMADYGVYAELKSSGVEHVFMASSENVLCRIADPLLIGLCLASDVTEGVKCVEKPPHILDRYNMFFSLADAMQPSIMKAQELAQELRTGVAVNGREVPCLMSISQFFFKLRYMMQVSRRLPERWHAVKRRQPHVNPKTGRLVSPPVDVVNSVRLEMFVGDAFPYAKSAMGLVVNVEEEWTNIRTSGLGVGSTTAAVMAVSVLHHRWFADAGAQFDTGFSEDASRNRCEVSPLVSYAGEGLLNYYGLHLSLPLHLETPTKKLLPAEPNVNCMDAHSGPGSSEAEAVVVDSFGALEVVEWRVIFHSLLKQQEAAHRAHMQDIFVEECDDDDSLLPPTSRSMRKAVEHWAEEVEGVYLEAVRRRETRVREGRAGRSLGGMFDEAPDEEDAAASPRSSPRSPPSKFAAESDVDLFDQVSPRSSPRTGRPMPKLPPLSNATSKSNRGGNRILLHKGYARNLFGVGSGYKPAPKEQTTRDRKEKLYEVYGNSVVAKRFETLRPGQQDAQWVHGIRRDSR